MTELPTPYYQEDGITLYCGDCRDILPLLPEKSVDLTVTSPPYDNLRTYEGFDWDFEATARGLFRITKLGGVCVWVVGDSTIDGSESLTSAKQKIYFREGCGFNIHDTMIYRKSGFNFPSNERYHQIWEYMFVLSRDAPKTFNPIMDRKNQYPGQVSHSFHRTRDGKKDMSSVKAKAAEEYGMRFNLWGYATGGGQISKDDVAHGHPAIFPEELAFDHIRSWSNAGDTILDPFIGSGTTAKMAKKLGRKCIGIDISSKYLDIAVDRLRQMELFAKSV